MHRSLWSARREGHKLDKLGIDEQFGRGLKIILITLKLTNS